MPRYESGGGRLPGDDIDNVLAIPATRLSQEGLLAVVMVIRIVKEDGFVVAKGLSRRAVGDSPAGECTGADFLLVLAVVWVTVHTHTHGE